MDTDTIHVGPLTSGHTNANAIADDLRELIPHVMRLTHTPGLNIAFSLKGKLMMNEGFGHADLSTRAPMTSESCMIGGSFTKLYTAIAVMQLIEQGVLALHGPVNCYLKEKLQVVNPLGDRDVTLHDLLTFRSGLARDINDGRLGEPPVLGEYLRQTFENDCRAEYESTLSRWNAKVGEKYQYSTTGIALLGYVVEAANPEALSLSDYVQQHVIEPLGLASTSLPAVVDERHVPREQLQKLATGYARFGNIQIPTPLIHSPAYPGITLLTTPSDHVRLLEAILNGGELDGARVLETETVRLMLTPQVMMSESARALEDGAFAGLAFELNNESRQDRYFGRVGCHTFGWWGDGRAYVEQDLVIAVFTNKWDMMGWNNPSKTIAPGLICEYVSRRLASRRYVRSGTRFSWAWKLSYIAGVLMAERLIGLMGIREPLDAALDRMVEGAALTTSDVHYDSWDPSGFRAGLRDASSTEMSPQGIQTFLRSERLQVAPEELELLAFEFGRRGGLAAPLTFWADAARTAPPVNQWFRQSVT